MSTAELELYEAIKPKLGEKEAQMLLRFMETKIGGEVEKGTSIFGDQIKCGRSQIRNDQMDVHFLDRYCGYFDWFVHRNFQNGWDSLGIQGAIGNFFSSRRLLIRIVLCPSSSGSNNGELR